MAAVGGEGGGQVAGRYPHPPPLLRPEHLFPVGICLPTSSAVLQRPPQPSSAGSSHSPLWVGPGEGQGQLPCRCWSPSSGGVPLPSALCPLPLVVPAGRNRKHATLSVSSLPLGLRLEEAGEKPQGCMAAGIEAQNSLLTTSSPALVQNLRNTGSHLH